MKILGIEHVGLAVKSAADNRLWGEILGIPLTGRETVADQGVNTEIFDTGRGKVELLEAIGDDGAITKFIDRRGEGIHHLCLEVADIASAITELQSAGIKLIYNQPRKGADNMLITFIHPAETNGVLLELAQKNRLPDPAG